jgi:hypothetical protein
MVASVNDQELTSRTGIYDILQPINSTEDGKNSYLAKQQRIQPTYEHTFIIGSGHFHEDNA